ncbi:Eco29kI family restriction endonuclease [Micromonospora coxensis]|uniref:Eco29kI family restriction endonuclease n=1 Tax=Micromonospora coxensis TaxID=356852 RepID=UPI00343570EF
MTARLQASEIGVNQKLASTKHFTFDLTGALVEQLHSEIPQLAPEPLTPSGLAEVAESPGVYQLYWRGDLVYIGKADISLRGRLYDHYRKISGRKNISVEDVSFTGLYLEGTWIPVGPEQMLIKRYGGEPLWNKNGFGPNDPGKERDNTRIKDSHFDAQFPADLDWPLVGIGLGVHSVRELIKQAKEELPYTFRFQDKYARHPDYVRSYVRISGPVVTADQLFSAIAEALPAGWQITVLPGYVIMYKNYPTLYQSQLRAYP